MRSAIAFVLLMVSLSRPASAQPIAVRLGEDVRFERSQHLIALPVLLDIAAGSGVNVAAIQATVSWNSAKFVLDSAKSDPDAQLVFNANGGSKEQGRFVFNAFRAVGMRQSARIALLYFTARQPEQIDTVRIDVDVLGDELGRDVRGTVKTSPAIIVRR